MMYRKPSPESFRFRISTIETLYIQTAQFFLCLVHAPLCLIDPVWVKDLYLELPSQLDGRSPAWLHTP